VRWGEAEFQGLDFDGEAPDPVGLAQRWRIVLETARRVVGLLPAEEAGRAVLTREGVPYRGEPTELRKAITEDALVFHQGCIRGAFPQIIR
jgi:hypothetical protein